jgi:hypothetical protein
MLRSAATPTCTEVQTSSEMKQITTRRSLRRSPTPNWSVAHLLSLKSSGELAIAIRLFKD